MKEQKLTVRPKSILQYLFCLIVIIYGQSMWLRINYVEGTYTMLAIISALVVSMLIVLEQKVYKKSLATAALLLVLLLLHYLGTSYGLKLLLFGVGVPLGLFIIYFSILWRKEQLLALFVKYSNIVILLAFISIILYSLGVLLAVLPSQNVTYYWADEYMSCSTYFHLLYIPQEEKFFGATFIRNCGIFCEAPSYAVPLVLSLLIEVNIKQIVKKKRVAILLLTIMTTFSTKAIILALLVLSLKLIEVAYGKQDKKSIFTRQSWEIIASTIVAILSVATILIIADKSDSNSYISRMDNIYSTLQAFFHYPIFGLGAGNEAAVAAYSLRTLERYGYSIGATLLLAEGGIYLTLIYVFPFIRTLMLSNQKWKVACVGIVFLGILFTSNITFFLSTTVVLALGYSYPGNNRQFIES